jgi:PAS domain S-box-containing protein
VDMDGNLLETNQAYLEMIGYTAEEARRLRYQDITPAKWHKFEADIIQQQVLTRGYSDTYEKEYIRKDGTVISIELRTYLIKGETGAPVGMWAFIRDITERKRVEEALQKQIMFTEAILDSLPGTFFLLDSQGRQLRTNRSGLLVSGYSWEELSNMHALEGIAEEDGPAAQRALAEVLEKGEASLEAQMLTKDGSKIPFLYTAKKFIIDGMPFILGTGIDITARKQAEELLRTEKNLSDAIIDSLPGIFYLFDEKGKFVRWNRRTEEVTGYSDTEIPFLYVTDFFEGEDRELIAHRFKSVFEEGSVNAEATLVTKHGQRIPYYFTGLRSTIGDKANVIGLGIDISTRKRTEEALQESEKKYRSLYQEFRGILDAIPDGVSLISPDLKIVWANETPGTTFMGKRPSETINQFCYQARHGRSAPCEICEVQDCFASGKPTSGESTTPEGRTFEIHAVPLHGDQGEVNAVIEVARDITLRKRAEEEQAKLKEQMQEVQKLESLGVLAGGIAHDFNNLLTAILGNADLALLSMSPASPARSNVEEITRASFRAADLCRQMLAYSGKGQFVVGRYDLSEIVREMAQILKVSVSKKATLRYFFAEDLPPVEVDATQMRQVIMNLITNASEALGDQSGFISVSTGVMDCDRTYLADSYLDDKLPEGEYVYLEVADTGSGIDEETRRRIFDPFFTTKFTGRGLGLAAVLGIVRGHQGAIKVYSEVGQGTTFKVLLPAREWLLGDRGHRAAQSVQTLAGGGTILLVDDDSEVRNVGSQMLERLGFKVLTAAHGKEGLKVFQECGNEIDCVILDLTMPEMGGEEVFRELRRLRSDVRVILSSGYNEQDVTRRFVGKGLAGFMQKPYTVAKLQEVLNSVLG